MSEGNPPKRKLDAATAAGDSITETRAGEPIASESSVQGRHRDKIRRLAGKVKNELANTFSRSKDSRTADPVLPIISHEGSSSSLRVEDGMSGVEQRTGPQVALQAADAAADSMELFSEHAQSAASAAQDGQADLDTADNVQDTYLQPLRIFNTVIGEIADIHPYVKIALGILSSASNIILAQVDRDKAVIQLLKKLSQVYRFVMEGETLRHISSTRTILEQISGLTLRCAHFIRDYAEKKNFWKRFRKNIVSETNTIIQQYNNELDALMQTFRDQVFRDMAISLPRTGERLDLSGMTYAPGAGLDTAKQCLPGTRTEILSQIKDWVKSTGDDVERVLWLSGPAGKGKSAIAHTVAKWFHDVGGLGSFYCFDHQRKADRRHEKVFATIARDLADHHPEMKRALAEAVQNDNALKNSVDIMQQWQKLLAEPLKKLSASTTGPIVVIIDALDESGGVETRRSLLRTLAGKLAVPAITELPKNIRIIVTSRPLSDIEAELTGAQHIRRMSMDDIPPEVAERDIHAYISKELKGLKDFQDEQFTVLAEMAGGLFEWARLACGYIKESHTGLSPMEYYYDVVSSDPAERNMLLHDMYRLILTDIMHMGTSTNGQRSQKMRSMELARFRSVMGQILGTSEPLPLASLNAMRHHFPTEKDRYDVGFMVKCMGSLLSGTTNANSPIRPLHASFRDFLTDQLRSGDFFIDVSSVQRDLAFASLRVMEHDLRFNICDLQSSYLPNCEDPGLQERIETRILPHLSYSCRFWTAHVRDTVFDKELAKEVKSLFDHERLFFWLEVLALINSLSGAVIALSLIAQWPKGHSEFKDLSLTAMDVQRFIQVFGGMILHSTPHLYVSALPFTPINSPLSRQYSVRFPNTLHVASGRDVHWPAAQTVLRGHTDEVTSVSFSPDGTRIATGSADGTARLWDTATGQPFGDPLEGHTIGVTSVSFSPDGTRIVTGSYDHTVRLWDTATGQPVGDPLEGHIEAVTSVSFSPDGTRIMTGSDDHTARLWDTATGQPVGDPLEGHTDEVTSVSFSPDGTRIATGSLDYTVRLWDTATGQPVGDLLEGHTDGVNSVSFSPDGTRIATGSDDRTVRLWDTATGQPVGDPLEGHTAEVTSVSFSPDGTRIATGSGDHTVRLWDTATGQPVGDPLEGHTAEVTSVSFSPDGTRIATGSEDHTVRLWDTAIGQPVGLEGHTDWVTSVSFSPDGTRIATGSWDRTVRLWDTATGQPVGDPLEGHTDGVTSVSFSPDGTRIATGSADDTVRLWDTATGQPVGDPLEGYTDGVTSVSFSPDGTRIATCSWNGIVWLWDTATGQPVGDPLDGHNDYVSPVSFSPDGTRIATGSDYDTVQLRDTATGQPVCDPLKGHTGEVTSVSFSPDGTRIATGSWDYTVRLWDTATGQPVGDPLEGHTSQVASVSFSPDGTRIATGSWDNTVRLWDTATGQSVGDPLVGHTDCITSVSFSPDGIHIVSGSWDQTIRLWDVAIRQPVQQCADSELDHSASSDEHCIVYPIETATAKTRNNRLIRLSSNSAHALCNPTELMAGAFRDGQQSTSFILDHDSGWVVGPTQQPLFWVPPASRARLFCPRTVLVIPRGGPELDLSRMSHGRHWQKCRDLPS